MSSRGRLFSTRLHPRMPVHPTWNVRVRRPMAGYRSRDRFCQPKAPNTILAPERWHPPGESKVKPRFIVEPAGRGYRHPVTVGEIRARLALLPKHFLKDLEVIQLSRMTRKRQHPPCYGIQWGCSIYLYPIEEDLVEVYGRQPSPAWQIEARMYGGEWVFENGLWKLTWREDAIKDYYLNNVLIHEIGHLVDDRNTRTKDRERFAEWFAIEYGYRVSRGRRSIPA